jgi:hypothetical protein
VVARLFKCRLRQTKRSRELVWFSQTGVLFTEEDWRSFQYPDSESRFRPRYSDYRCWAEEVLQGWEKRSVRSGWRRELERVRSGKAG